MDEGRSLVREYLEALLIAFIFATFARTFVVQAFKIPSGSMEQNLLIGDHILVNKFVYGPEPTPLERALLPSRAVRRGDVVVFKFPEDPTRDFIKRCVGLPGDIVQIVDKVLFVNGEKVDDAGFVYHTSPVTYPNSPFLAPGFRARDNFGPFEVPTRHLFFLGDNRDNSNDSRFWGTVPIDYVKGRAFIIYWSFAARDSGSPEASDVDGRLHQLMRVGKRFFADTRWDRTFHIVR